MQQMNSIETGVGEQLSAYVRELQSLVRRGVGEGVTGPEKSNIRAVTLADVKRCLGEPLNFLFQQGHERLPKTEILTWQGPVESTIETRQYFIQHLLLAHIEFILDHITLDWLSAFPIATKTILFESYFLPPVVISSTPPPSHSTAQRQQPLADRKVWMDAMGVTALQVLIGRLDRNQRLMAENHSYFNKTILNLLHRYLEKITLMDLYQAVFDPQSLLLTPLSSTDTPGVTAKQEVIWENNVISKLLSIPTRVANAVGVGNLQQDDSAYRLFRETEFFHKIGFDFGQCLELLGDDTKAINAKGLAAILTRLIRLGQGSLLVKANYESLLVRLSRPGAENLSKNWKLVLAHLIPRNRTSFLKYLAAMANADKRFGGNDSILSVTGNQNRLVRQFALMLDRLGYGPLSSKSGGDGGISVQEVLSSAVSSPQSLNVNICRALICLQSGWPTNFLPDGTEDDLQEGEQSPLMQTFFEALAIWSEEEFVKHAKSEAQKYISQILLIMVGYMSASTLQSPQVIQLFWFGIQNWLHIPELDKKIPALVLAEEISKISQAGSGSAADFGLNANDLKVMYLRSLVSVVQIDGMVPLAEGEFSGKVEPPTTAVLENENERDEAHDSSTVVAEPSDDEEDEDPDSIVDRFAKYRSSAVDSSDEEEEEGLEAYAMDSESDSDSDSGEEALPSTSGRKKTVPAPIFIRDLLAYLRANEDYEKFERGLLSASNLIQTKAGTLELEEFAVELTRVLVRLQDPFDMGQLFLKSKEEALVHLVVACPRPVGLAMAELFYSKELSLGHRLQILSAVALGAKILSDGDGGHAGNGSTAAGSKQPQLVWPLSTSSNLIPFASISTTTTFQSLTDTIALAQTRRFSKKSEAQARQQKPRPNVFANLAPHFLGAFLGRWGGNRGPGMERGYDVLRNAPVVLLDKFVLTLGVIVYQAGNSPRLLEMTRELMRFLLALRYFSPGIQQQQQPPQKPHPKLQQQSQREQNLTREKNIKNTNSLTDESLEEAASARESSSILQMGSPNSSATKLLSGLSSPSTLFQGMGSIHSQQLPSSRTSSSISGDSRISTHGHNKDLLRSILFDLLILVSPASHGHQSSQGSGVLSDRLMMQEFGSEILEIQQWGLELWENPVVGDEKTRVYCAALLQRCQELITVAM